MTLPSSEKPELSDAKETSQPIKLFGLRLPINAPKSEKSLFGYQANDKLDFRGVCIVLLLVASPQLYSAARKFTKNTIADAMFRQEIQDLATQNPLFLALSEHEPQSYKQFNEALVRSAGKNTGEREAMMKEAFQQYLAPVLSEYLTVASNQTLVEIAQFTSETVFQNQSSCKSYIVNRDFMQFVTSADDSDRVMQILGQVVETGATEPVQLSQQQQSIRPTVQSILPALKSKHGEDVGILASPAAMAADPDKACAVLPDFYQALLQRTPAESGPVFRFMWAQ